MGSPNMTISRLFLKKPSSFQIVILVIFRISLDNIAKKVRKDYSHETR